MVTAQELENILQKFALVGEPVKWDEFLIKLLIGDQSQNVDSLRQNFKDNFLNPLLNKLPKFVSSVESISKEIDETSKKIKSLNKKINEVQITNNKQEENLNNKPNQPSYTDSPNLNDFINQFQNNFNNLNQNQQFNNETSLQKIDNLNVSFTNETKLYLNDLLKKYFDSFDFISYLKEGFINLQSAFKNLQIPQPLLPAPQIIELEPVIKDQPQEIIQDQPEKIDFLGNLENLIFKTFEPISESLLLPLNTKQIQEEELAGEQATLGPKENLITFSDDGKRFLLELTDKLDNAFGLHLDPVKKSLEDIKEISEESLENENERPQDSSVKQGFFEGLVSGLTESLLGKIAIIIPGAIAAIGGLGVLAGFYWPEIRKYIEERFGKDWATTFDSLRGSITGLSKFLFTGGINLGARVAGFAGRMFSTLGELLTNSIDEIFQSFTKGGGGAVGGTLVAGGAGAKGFLLRAAGSVLQGVSIVTLKALPLIGSLISFGYAYSRFRDNDPVGGTIDLIGGLANLLAYTPAAPVALPLTLGAAALNAILDYQTAGTENKTEAKLNVFKNWGSAIYEFLTKTPVIGGLIKFSEGIGALVAGNVKEGLSLMNEMPILGSFAGIILSFMNAQETNPETGQTTFSLTKLLDNLKRMMFKNVVKIFPEGFGIRSFVAGLFGYDNYEEILSIPDYTGPEQEIKAPKESARLQKLKEEAVEFKSEEEFESSKTNAREIIDKRKMLEEELRLLEQTKDSLDQEEQRMRQNKKLELKKYIEETQEDLLLIKYKQDEFLKQNGNEENIETSGRISREEAEASVQRRKDRIKQQKEASQRSQTVPVDDIISNQDRFIYEPRTGTKFSLNPNDTVMAFQKNGFLDQELKSIKEAVNLMVKNNSMDRLTRLLEQKFAEPMIVNVANSNQITQNNNKNSLSMLPDRDHIRLTRDQWISS